MLPFRHLLAQHLDYPRRNSRYSVPQMILALVYPIVLGLGSHRSLVILALQRYLPILDRAVKLPGPADFAWLLTPRPEVTLGTAAPRQ